jgi:hypothetical protein
MKSVDVLIDHDTRQAVSLDYQISSTVLTNVGHETVTAARNRDHESMLILTFAENFSKCRDLYSQVSFFNELPRPHPIEKLVLSDYLAMTLDQGDKQIESFWIKSDRLTLPSQLSPRAIELEIGKSEGF